MVPTRPLMPAALALLLGTLPALAETPPAPPIAVTTTEQAQDTTRPPRPVWGPRPSRRARTVCSSAPIWPNRG